MDPRVLDMLTQQGGAAWSGVVLVTYWTSLAWLTMEALMIVLVYVLAAAGVMRSMRFDARHSSDEFSGLGLCVAIFCVVCGVLFVALAGWDVPHELSGVMAPEARTLLDMQAKR